MKRKQFIQTSALGVGALALEGPLVALLGSSEPTPVPARVGATDINQTRAATEICGI